MARAARGGDGPAGATRRVLTIPNVLSFLRILLIPVILWLLLGEGTPAWGIVLLGTVVATDWVDGTVARRTGQVTELGKILDPTADRLVIAAALVAFVVRGAIPLWAALLVVIRDGAVLVVGGFLLARGIRLEVRFIGKMATAMLMAGIPMVAWGGFDLPLGPAATAVGWPVLLVGIVEYYVAAGLYLRDARHARPKTS